MCPTLYIIIPCYNEEKVLPLTAPQFLSKIKELTESNLISDNSRILFINDGSSDNTWNIINDLAAKDNHYIGISQSRNRGHQNAVYAGLMEAKDLCDITISIDCDGQDDINAMNEMVKQYHNGYEVVYGVRSSRETDTFFKRFTAESFYKLMNKMGAETVYNHADYRLVSSKVLQSFSQFKEVNLFLRGLFPLVGYKSTSVYYKRNERLAGESHYPLSKMLALAINGITSLSIKPIRFITSAGVIFFIIGLLVLLFTLIFGSEKLLCTVLSFIIIFSGIILIALGVVGEYIGKIYMETKERPKYIISERTKNFNKY